MSHMAILMTDEVLRTLFKWDKFPVSTSFGRIFKLFTQNHCRECLHNWFRTGSAYSANGSVEFMKECFAKLPKRIWKIFVRADSAFFDGALLDLLESKKYEYDYFCYISNLKLNPWATHKRYGKRATSENWIEWCKNQMSSGRILTQEFWANSAIFQTSILAHNLLVWMMWLNNEDGFNEEPNTIRMCLIHVPARLMPRSRQWIVQLSIHVRLRVACKGSG